MATVYCILIQIKSLTFERPVWISVKCFICGSSGWGGRGGWRRGWVHQRVPGTTEKNSSLLISQCKLQAPLPLASNIIPPPFPLVKMVIYCLQLNAEIDATLSCFYASITIFWRHCIFLNYLINIYTKINFKIDWQRSKMSIFISSSKGLYL